MPGLMALVGAGEYLEVMDEVDQHLLNAAAPERRPRVVCLPTAAGEEGEASIARWSRMGVAHFRKLGAEVEAPPIVDHATADDPRWTALIEAADLIYFSGGDPQYLCRALTGSRAWAAVQAAHGRGAVLAGCSAGAMILGAQVPDVRSEGFHLQPAFNLVGATLILPHFDQVEGFRPGVTALMQSRLAEGQFALGIDEHTALVGRPGEPWAVMGAGRVWLLTATQRQATQAGQALHLPA